jgi:hypothetical protein
VEIKQLSIQSILDEIGKGLIRIPAFQRGFVWEPDRVALLMDSIYKKYPFGTLLIWRTNTRLKHDRKLGPFILPEPVEQYPIEYVLDGQQRLTAIYCVFTSALDLDQSFEWKDIYFDLSVGDDAQGQQFLALAPTEVDSEKHFPLRAMFNSTEYRRLTRPFSEALAERIDHVYTRFQQVQIPSNVYQTEEKSVVSVIFERINRQGLPLDTLQLLSAWTWSEDFQLQAEFDSLFEEIEEFGFNTDDAEENLVLRCCAAVLNSDPAPDALLNLSGKEVRDGFERVKNGIRGAIDFLKESVLVTRVQQLPFQTILVPLSVFFAAERDSEIKLTNEQRRTLNGWFWWTCWSRRYSSGVLRNLKTDIDFMSSVKALQLPNRIRFDRESLAQETFFLTNKSQMSTVNTKTFILLLVQRTPRSFLSGQRVSFEDKYRMSNRSEFHHVYPRAFLKSTSKQEDADCLANFAVLSKADNRQISASPPNKYIDMLPLEQKSEILESALLKAEWLSTGSFEDFLSNRAKALSEFAKSLITDSSADLRV